MQALNAYEGAVVLVSHDRHMLELTADRLVLVDDGTAKEFSGTLDDYTDMILGKPPKGEKRDKKADRKAEAQQREKGQALRNAVKTAETELAKLTTERSAIERAMFDPANAAAHLTTLTMTDLMKRRADIEARLEAAEARWVEASEQLEAVA